MSIKRLTLTFVAVITLSFSLVVAAPSMASADTKAEICKGVNSTGGGVGCDDTTGQLDKLLATGINLFSATVSIAAIIMIMVGGLKYITAAGEPGKLTSAKNTIIYALIGLLVVALAQFIVKFVLAKTA